MSSHDSPRTAREETGLLWLTFLLVGILVLSVFFVWVLFFSPMGQSDATLVDFNKDLHSVQRRIPSPKQQDVLRVAVAAMISPKDTLDVYGELIEYLGEKLQMKPKLVQRMTYREINDLLEEGKIDLGFICTGPYLQLMKNSEIQALVTSVVHGKAYYRAYIIVPRKSPVRGLQELKGKVFAFTDPDSLTGFLYPNLRLQRKGENAETFFAQTFFTRSHSDSIHAVSYDLADGASVNSLVYDYLQNMDPERTNECRILEVSQPLGMPPVVMGPTVPDALRQRTRDVFLGMDKDPYGKEILKRMEIDAFIPAETIRGLYEETRAWAYPDGEKATLAHRSSSGS